MKPQPSLLRLWALCMVVLFLPGILGAQAMPALIGYYDLERLLKAQGSRVLVLDVRTPEEFATGHLPEAILLPYDQIQASFQEEDLQRPIVVYCRSGRRSALAKATLMAMGYRRVSDFGGIDNWKGELAKPRP